MIDTHAHLDASADSADELVARAREAGVTRIVTIGTHAAEWGEALAIAERHEGVFAALGIHPHEAVGADVGTLRDALADPRAVAVGEAGLDYFRDHAPRDVQRRIFDEQLALAAELGKPVVIHTRAADEDTLAALAGFDGTVVLHCFSSSPLLEPALANGWYVSFAGNVTYKNAHDLRSAAFAVPAERLLAETDSPYLTPVPLRGRPNEPANVMHTLAALAQARNADAGELEAQIDANATRCFSL
ncbi:MAG: TatD family hydrolase [Gaiellaceae bacterium]